jgi:uncharacterized Fe-S cluster-containing radical SAM superfamily protein
MSHVARSDAAHVAAAYLVLPTSRGANPPDVSSGAAAELLRRLKHLALCQCGAEFEILLVNASLQLLFTGGMAAPRLPGSLAGSASVVFLANAGFLLHPNPPFTALTAAAAAGRFAVQISRDNADLCALAVPRQSLVSPVFLQAVSHLAASVDARVDGAWMSHIMVERLPATGSQRKNSPAAAVLSRPRARHGPFAPTILNTALAELVDHPAGAPPKAGSPEALRSALLAQRQRSAVPWVFNAMINHIEYRTTRAVLDSLAPEVHLSLTGACNIECGFCSYAHKKAYFEYVSLAEVQRLDWLRQVCTLRLSSGLGEPTLNPNLPAIIRFLAEHYPHLILNFFTNGIALNRKGLIDALVHNVTWINVSINNARQESYAEMCGRDLFDRLGQNLRQLHEAKLAHNSVFPIVHGSMVLTAKSVAELPLMPALCRSLGIDRFTAFPFASLQTDCRYGASETLDKCREQYDALYLETVRAAENYQVSIEIPPPSEGKRLAFGLEVRPLYDFARIEEHRNPAALLVDELAYEQLARPNCPQIWQTASIGARFRVHQGSASHFLYPCLGPLCTVDFSTQLGFDFPCTDGFLKLWNHPIFVKLRTAQQQPGLSEVCDVCRGCDTRHPDTFSAIETLLQPWRPAPVLLASPQLIGRMSGC